MNFKNITSKIFDKATNLILKVPLPLPVTLYLGLVIVLSLIWGLVNGFAAALTFFAVSVSAFILITYLCDKYIK